MAHVEITSPTAGARLSSPLAIVSFRTTGASGAAAVLTVGEVRHVLAVPAGDGVVRENVTLLEGDNRLRVEVDGAAHELVASVEPSVGLTLTGPDASVATRAADLSGRYQGVSCPAGVIAVNGFMQQVAVPAAEGTFAEKIVLGPGANHVAVQIGERYTTRLVRGTFAPSKLLVTLLWDTNLTDLDLYVREPGGRTVWYQNKTAAGNLDVDRTQGFGPENYSLGAAAAAAGEYVVRVHYYADRGVGRSEWTCRVIADEGTAAQQRRTFLGILDRSLGHAGPSGAGADWDDVCTIQVSAEGRVALAPPRR
jgi:hypothetical protein